MPIDLTKLFNRLRAIDRALLSHNRYLSEYNSAVADPIRSIDYESDKIFTEYTTSEQDLVSGKDGLYSKVQDLIDKVNADYFDFLSRLARNTLVRMAGDAYRIQDNNLEKSLKVLIEQMRDNGDSVARPSTLNATVSLASSNFGNGAVVLTLASKQNVGQLVENAFSETIEISVSASGSFGVPAVMTLVGDADVAKPYRDWPAGSGVNISYRPLLPQSPSNRITNAGLDSWSGSVPVGWSVTSGTSPADYNIESGVDNIFYPNGSALRVSNTTQVVLEQNVTANYPNNAAVFLGTWLRKSGTPTDTNKMVLRLVDDHNNPITDVLDNPIRVQVQYNDAGLSSTEYRLFGAIFFTTNKAYSVVKLQLVFETTSGAGSMLCDGVFFDIATEIYPGGPHFVIVQGSRPFVISDTGVITINNSGSKWQRVFERLFDMTSKYGLLLPSSDAPTISD
jgi:hypothetical protein